MPQPWTLMHYYITPFHSEGIHYFSALEIFVHGNRTHQPRGGWVACQDEAPSAGQSMVHQNGHTTSLSSYSAGLCTGPRGGWTGCGRNAAVGSSQSPAAWQGAGLPGSAELSQGTRIVTQGIRKTVCNPRTNHQFFEKKRGDGGPNSELKTKCKYEFSTNEYSSKRDFF